MVRVLQVGKTQSLDWSFRLAHPAASRHCAAAFGKIVVTLQGWFQLAVFTPVVSVARSLAMLAIDVAGFASRYFILRLQNALPINSPGFALSEPGFGYNLSESTPASMEPPPEPRQRRGVAVRMKAKRFRHAITIVGEWLGHPLTFAFVTLYGFGWIFFDGSGIDWHGVATMATLYLTLIILRTDRRDTEALHAKLDELLRALEGPDEALADIDQREPEEIARIRERRRDPEQPGDSDQA